MNANPATPAARAKRVPVTYNFRSLDGLPTAHGRIRDRVLYRSDGLARLDDTGRAALVELGIGSIWDLRGPEEVAKAPSGLADLKLRIHLGSMEPGSLADSAEQIPTLPELYRMVLDKGGAVAVGLARSVTADAPDGIGTLIHCSAGKDRTGVMTALLLDTVGVDRDAIVADYAATEGNLDGEWLAGMEAMLGDTGIEFTDELREIALTSPASAMIATLAHIDTEWGGSAGYLRTHGLDEEEIAALTAALVLEH